MLSSLLALLVAATDSLTGPGVSHALAAQRAAQISEVRYALSLDVRGRDTATGSVVVTFQRRLAGDVILDFRGPSHGRVKVNGQFVEVGEEQGHLVIPSRALRTGANEVSLSFTALIAPAGASVIRFHDPVDGADYLYTLLVPADANQLFPCFDQPDLKARVTLQLTTPERWTAVANGMLTRADTANGITFHFRESDPISTYLVAFAAGPWAVRTAEVEGTRVSMYARASRIREAETDTLVALNIRALRWLERYTAQPFPFQKLDFVLAPAFPFGGMEHPGAIFYNEDSFIFRERPTLSQTLGRQATIYHEVAHQWFGDFTTMRWFDDLWLKEGFATYMAAVMQADLSPASNAWKTFFLRNKPAAYSVDASLGTTAVWQSLDNLDQAKSNYGAIVYNKAPGILKQLDHLVGDTAFRDGLRGYLRAHPYGNAEWRDLLGAVGTAAHRPLDEWGSAYIQRRGMPVITQQLRVSKGRIAELSLVQSAAQRLSGTSPWPLRMQVLLGYANAPSERIDVELRGRLTTVPVQGRRAPDFVFANASDYAYVLVRPDERSVRWLESHIGEVRDEFLRAMLWGALWDEVRAARLAPTRFLAMALRDLPNERDEEIAPVLIGRITRVATAYLGSSARRTLAPALERVLWRGAADTTRAYGIRRNHLDAFIAVTETPAGIAQLESLLDSGTFAGAALRSPTRWSVITTLVARAAPSAERRVSEEARRDSTSEGRRGAFVAGAARADAGVKAEYWQRWFADRNLNEDWVTSSLRAFHDPDQEDLTAPYLLPALDSLPWVQKNRRIFFLGRWVQTTVDGQRSPDALARLDAFLARRADLPRDLKEKILQSRDDLARTVAIRRRFP